MGYSTGGKYNRINTEHVGQSQPASSRPNQSQPAFSRPNQSQPASNQPKRQRSSTKQVDGPEEQCIVPPVTSNQPKRRRRSTKQIDVPTEKDTLPPVRNDASMTELLRECEAANPQPFRDDEYNDDDQLDASLNVSDRHSVGGSHHIETDDTSSEEDEPPEEMEHETISVSAGCDFTVRNSDTQKESRGLARPHTLVPGQQRPKAYIYLGDLIGDEVSGILPEIRFEWNQFWPKWREVDAKVKERLWNAFKNYFDLSEVVESSARHLFLKQSGKWYREAIATTKKEALNAVKKR